MEDPYEVSLEGASRLTGDGNRWPATAVEDDLAGRGAQGGRDSQESDFYSGSGADPDVLQHNIADTADVTDSPSATVRRAVSGTSIGASTGVGAPLQPATSRPRVRQVPLLGVADGIDTSTKRFTDRL